MSTIKRSLISCGLPLASILLVGCFSGEHYELTQQTILVRAATTQPTSPLQHAKVTAMFIGGRNRTGDRDAAVQTFKDSIELGSRTGRNSGVTDERGVAPITLKTASSSGFFRRNRCAGEQVRGANWLFRVASAEDIEYIAMLHVEEGKSATGSKFTIQVEAIGPMQRRSAAAENAK